MACGNNIELSRVYLKFLDCDRVDYDTVIKGIEKAKSLGASHVRVIDPLNVSSDILEIFLESIASLNMLISLDIPFESASIDYVEMIKRYASHVDFGITFTPPLFPSGSYFTGLLANVHINEINYKSVEDDICMCFDLYQFARVKLFAYVHRIRNIEAYFYVIEKTKALYKVYGDDKIHSLFPPWLLDTYTMRLTRTMCSHDMTVGILSDGGVCICNVDLSKFNHIPNLKEQSLENIVLSYEPIVDFRALNPNLLQGVCSRCIFKTNCCNICPSLVFNFTGSFYKSFPDCQYLYDKGAFPCDILV